MPTPNYPLNFSSSAYGAVPYQTQRPKSIYEESQKANPNLISQGASADSVIGNQLSGTLSPQTVNAIHDRSAEFGVSSGMPGSQFAGSMGLRNLGLTVENLQNQGLQNYLNSLKTIGSQQLDPTLTSGLETYNNQIAAAPNPAAAAQQEYALYQSQKSPGGGTGIYSGPVGPPKSTGMGILNNGFSPYNPPPASVYGYNQAGVWGDLAGKTPWAGSASDNTLDSYDAEFDPYSPDYQPAGAQ